ncbi:GNAT family N-acetyltransferase [Ignatzschineria rhizosphaerae]|uniref:GNAT family N-acetyltransferase n=1 Tax=Ignatzschineria rhizosphaerae TaxID=2923279 RepID=A0ABY3WZZ7_9GAMM|nr:GNAT family N-acetyltransferase [Ignatzschineria rhizosphaerae]UNM95615.1 GNAT family N-acetyltransferase [Ignatzschineria rhizosphaerae]
MQIEQLVDYKSAPMELLLLADPSEAAIAEYLGTSILWVAKIDDQIAGIIVLQKLDQKMLEIMNLAVGEDYRRRGIGRKFIFAALEYAKEAGFHFVKIATGNSSIHQLKLYQSCGFVIDQVIENYFLEHYSEPIYEDGMQCTDRVELLYTL